MWHMNPLVYAPGDIHPIKKVTAQNIWDYDKQKQTAAENTGLNYIVVWEKDYRSNKIETVLRTAEEIKKWKQ